MKYEYKVIVIQDFAAKDQEQLLNHYGEAGWELVSTVVPIAGDSSPAFAYFKRAIPIKINT